VNTRDQHAEAVTLAITEIEAFQTLLNVAREKGNEAVRAVARAVGGSGMESAANALNGTAETRDRLPELIGNLEVVVQELRRYGGGF
jgi:hypothetical protein